MEICGKGGLTGICGGRKRVGCGKGNPQLYVVFHREKSGKTRDFADWVWKYVKFPTVFVEISLEFSTTCGKLCGKPKNVVRIIPVAWENLGKTICKGIISQSTAFCFLCRGVACLLPHRRITEVRWDETVGGRSDLRRGVRQIGILSVGE